jgi:hypothetical protein
MSSSLVILVVPFETQNQIGRFFALEPVGILEDQQKGWITAIRQADQSLTKAEQR